ncbi:NAD-dependent epimerase/dehydratase family protein [Schumannella luteola]
MRIAVTGGSGKLGRAVVAHLRYEGHEVLVLDRVAERDESSLALDLTNYGHVVDALAGCDAAVHLAAIPAPGIVPDAATFENNMLASYNVLQAARRVGIRRIVFASSETVLGLPFDVPPPYIPVDEEYDTRPESVYSLGKHLEEELARKLVRWDPELSITALRFSNVMAPSDYAEFGTWQDDATLRKWNLWGYIDARDGAQAVLRSLERGAPGFDVFIIAAADTVMTRSNESLVAEVFPGVEVRGELGEHDSLLSIAKARRELGYEPKYSWRDA